MNNPPQPLHTAEEVVAFLREEIVRLDGEAESIHEQRAREIAQFEADHHAAPTLIEKARVVESWSSLLRGRDLDFKVAEGKREALCRTLQYLTGELRS